MGENAIAYQNKDIASKVFAEKFKGKSLSVYGINIPKVIDVLPTNLPEISANELRIDNLFLLEDGTIAIIDYESSYSEESKVKYLNYITRVINRYKEEGILDIELRMIVIYTADVQRDEVQIKYDVGCMEFCIKPAFLSELDSEEIKNRLTEKVNNNIPLTEEELMEFIILPLTYRTDAGKKKAIESTIALAKNIKDSEEIQAFILSGIIVFSNKFVDEETGNKVRRWLSMTVVGRIINEEIEAAAKEAAKEANIQMAKRMLDKNKYSLEEIADNTSLTIQEVEELAAALSA